MCINLMIADDHIMIREGIKQLLEFDGDMKVILETGDGEECLKLLENSSPDVLLLDINMPKKNGIEVLREIRKSGSDLKVLMLTVHNEVEYLIKALELGLNGYILKDSESAELKKAIFSIMEGEKYIQPSLIPALNARLINKDEDKDKVEQLTKREIEVLAKVAKGMFNREIAVSLNIRDRTVKNHISNIFNCSKYEEIQSVNQLQTEFPLHFHYSKTNP